MSLYDRFLHRQAATLVFATLALAACGGGGGSGSGGSEAENAQVSAESNRASVTFADVTEARGHYQSTDGIQFDMPDGWSWRRLESDSSSGPMELFTDVAEQPIHFILYSAEVVPEEPDQWFLASINAQGDIVRDLEWEGAYETSEANAYLAIGTADWDFIASNIIAGSCTNAAGYLQRWQAVGDADISHDDLYSEVSTLIEQYCALSLVAGDLDQIAAFKPYYFDEADIVVALLDQTSSYTSSYYGWLNDYALLFNNGLALLDFPLVALSQFDVLESMRNFSHDWVPWRLRDGVYEILVEGEWEGLEEYSRCLAYGDGGRLDGGYDTSSGSMSAFGSSSSRVGVVFTQEGEFERWSNYTGGYSLGYGSTASVSYYEQTDDSSFSGVITSQVVSGSTEETQGNADRTGTYSISGMNMTLNYYDGHSQSFFFCDREERDQIYFGGSILFLDKE